MYGKFSDRLLKVMALANQQAQLWNHEYIGTEHLLLGLLREGGGIACEFLRDAGFDLAQIQAEVEKTLKRGPDMVTMGKLPQTPRAKLLIERTIARARETEANCVGTDHLLSAMLDLSDDAATQVLVRLGVQKHLGKVLSSADALQVKIDILLRQKDECIKNADYAHAAVYRDQAEALRSKLEEMKRAQKAPKVSRSIKYLDETVSVFVLDLNRLSARSMKCQAEAELSDFTTLSAMAVEVDNFPLLGSDEIALGTGKALVLNVGGRDFVLSGKSAVKLVREVRKMFPAPVVPLKPTEEQT